MKNFPWKRIYPHLIAIGVFLIVALIYCKPAIEGKVLQQSDNIHWKGMAQNSFEYKEKNGHFPLWNTHLFSGMPSYQVAIDGHSYMPDFLNILSLGLPKPVNFFFLACICFYILASILGINYLIGILSSLAFAYSTYDPVIISVGHDTKMLAIAFMPAVLGGLYLIFTKRYLLGAFATALFASMEVSVNHPQITYYLFLVIGVMGLFFLIKWIRNKEWKHILIVCALSAVTGAVAIFNSSLVLLTTYDYTKYTMRGGKTLEISENGEVKKANTTGLDKDYAFSYSFGRGEIVTFFMPTAYGGSSSETFDENSKVVAKLVEKGVPESNAIQLAGGLPKYWGGISPSTAGPVYLGAIICILAVIGMFVIKNKNRWWLFAASVLGIFMAWGGYFTGFNNILFDHLPMYNKFRAPSMALVIPQLLFPILAALALQAMLIDATSEELKAKFKYVLYAVGGLFAVAAIIYLLNDFSSSIDDQIIKAYTNPQNGSAEFGHTIVNALIADRKDMFLSGLLRTIMFIAIVVGLLWLYTRKMLKPIVIIIILLVVNTIDLLVVDNKYLNTENYLEADAQQAENFTPTPIDKEILQDKDPHFRVYKLSPDRFSDAITSYFHRSIGGYHAAKLRIYQDLIENQLSKGMNMGVLNMLDTKYFIVPPQQQGAAPQLHTNNEALGATWFVKDVKFVNGPVEEIKALDSIQPAQTAFVDAQFKSLIPEQVFADSTAKISLAKYDNDTIQYTSSSKSNQFAVFSEIYYPSGWNAYIDGKKTDYCKVNYVLRGMYIPAGDHKIEFRFEPASYYTGQKLTYVGNAIFWLITLLCLGSAFLSYRKKKSVAA